jgi:hypothetical protein
MKLRNAALLVMVTLGLGLAGCEKRAETPVEKATDSVKDALDMREHEKLKDAGENLQDAAQDATEAAKDAVE